MLLPFGGKVPRDEGAVFVAPNATVLGDVVLGPGSSVWYGAVLRGDDGTPVSYTHLGTATVYLDGYEVGTVDLVTHQEYVSDFRTDLQSTLLLMAALIVLLAVLSFFTLVAGGGSLNLGRRRKARRR